MSGKEGTLHTMGDIEYRRMQEYCMILLGSQGAKTPSQVVVLDKTRAREVTAYLQDISSHGSTADTRGTYHAILKFLDHVVH